MLKTFYLRNDSHGNQRQPSTDQATQSTQQPAAADDTGELSGGDDADETPDATESPCHTNASPNASALLLHSVSKRTQAAELQLRHRLRLWRCGCLVLLLAFSTLLAALLISPIDISSAASALTSALTRAQPASYPSPASSALSLYERWRAVCEGSNVVLGRMLDGVHGEPDSVRNWTVSALTFTQPTAACSSVPQLLESLARGQRLPLPGHGLQPANLSALNRSSPSYRVAERAAVEWSRSYFVPQSCSLRWWTGEEACALLNGFSHVLWLGDSLQRHTTQGLFMLLTEDLRYGGLPRLSLQRGLYDGCQCDGQYSESALCRDYNAGTMQNLQEPRAYGLCSAGRHHKFTFRFAPAHTDVGWSDFCSADPRPRALLLQAGAHYGSNWNATLEHFIRPTLATIKSTQSACPHPLRWKLAWMGMPAQSRRLDALYPSQTREAALRFNDALRQRLSEADVALHIDVLDVWNLTVNAATSDGFHYLSDVNLLRATAFLNLLHLWTQVDDQK